MNKYYIGIGAAIVLATPIAATVSCGSKNKKEEVKQPAKVEEVKNVNVNPQPKIETEVKSASDTKWTEEQQKAEEAANEKATADAEKAFADKKAELEKTATDESKANLEKAMFNHMETLEENIADIQKIYEEKIVSHVTQLDVEAKFEEWANKLAIAKEALATLHSADYQGHRTIFVSNMQPYSREGAHTIYDKYNANKDNGYHSDKFDVFISAIDKYHDAGGDFQSAVDAIQKAIDVLEAK